MKFTKAGFGPLAQAQNVAISRLLIAKLIFAIDSKNLHVLMMIALL